MHTFSKFVDKFIQFFQTKYTSTRYWYKFPCIAEYPMKEYHNLLFSLLQEGIHGGIRQKDNQKSDGSQSH